MNKKIVAVIVIVLVGFGIIMINLKLNSKSSNLQENTTINNKKNNDKTGNKQIAVVYFSVSGTTKGVAEVISNEIGADLIEIVPKEKYTTADLNWNDSKSRTSIECNDSKSRPEIANKIVVDNYDVIYLGYPIWWGNVPHIILTFMDTYKLDGKTIIPFCTSGGTGISGSMSTLKGYNENVNWVDGKRLGSSENEIKNWINSLKY